MRHRTDEFGEEAYGRHLREVYERHRAGPVEDQRSAVRRAPGGDLHPGIPPVTDLEKLKETIRHHRSETLRIYVEGDEADKRLWQILDD